MEQPFYIGQKVVCVETGGNPFSGNQVIEGDVYTIASQVKCPLCGYWNVSVVEVNSHHGYPNECCRCPHVIERVSTCVLIGSHRFAPLNPPRVNAIPELLKAPVEERVDHHHPVKILTKDG